MHKTNHNNSSSQFDSEKLIDLINMLNSSNTSTVASRDEYSTLIKSLLSLIATLYLPLIQQQARGQDERLTNKPTTHCASRILQCVHCHVSFDSLSDLSMHMLNTKHFPANTNSTNVNNGLINVETSHSKLSSPLNTNANTNMLPLRPKQKNLTINNKQLYMNYANAANAITTSNYNKSVMLQVLMK